jgi:HAD superfamily hydrolase (TIGR01509 family)
MIKHIIFDLDGVLVDARELHYYSLNKALESFDKKYIITKEEHFSTYDGLPTNKKLVMLTQLKGLPVEFYKDIWSKKQEYTAEFILSNIDPDERLITVLDRLKREGYSISVASNSIRETVKNILFKKGFLPYINFFLSNEDVKRAKPNTEIFLRSMIQAEVDPKECLIIEDSNIGKKAAQNSGAYLCPVLCTNDVTYEKIRTTIDMANNTTQAHKWVGGNINVLIPMAGAGTRFEKAGYTFPKPLIEVRGKPMIQVVVNNINIEGQHIFIAQRAHSEKYNLKDTLNLISPGCKLTISDSLTEGAACTTLLAKEYINNDTPLIMANSDQYIDWDSSEFMWSMMADHVDGGILVFESTHPKWSFAKLNNEGYVCEVAEKRPISNLATVGIYFWRKGSDYVKYAEQMIKKNIRVNNEFYVCPVFNEAIQDGKKIKVFKIANDKMWGIGTPEDLSYFLENHP